MKCSLENFCFLKFFIKTVLPLMVSHKINKRKIIKYTGCSVNQVNRYLYINLMLLFSCILKKKLVIANKFL